MANVAPTVFVFRPNGTQADNIFTDWLELMRALWPASTDPYPVFEGRKVIEFDDSLAPDGCVMPPRQAAYDMKDVMWTGPAPSAGKPRAVVRIQEGVTFANLRMIGGQITIVNEATSTSPIADFVENALHQVQIGLREDCGNAQLINPGGAPLFDLGEVPPAPVRKRVSFFVQNTLIGIAARVNGQLVSSANPLIANDQGVEFGINFIGQNQTGERLVRGRPVLFGILSSSAQIGFDNAIAVDTSTGEVANEFGPITRIQRRVQPHPPTPPAKSDAEIGEISRPNALLRCDGSGSGFEVTLPSIRSGFTFGTQEAVPLYTGGQELVVAEVAGGNNLRVRPTPDDTIDGLPDPVPIAARESRVFASDGHSNWITIASHLTPPISLARQLSVQAIQLESLTIAYDETGFGRRDFLFDLPRLSGRGFLLLNLRATGRVAVSLLMNGELVVSRDGESDAKQAVYEALPPNLLEGGNALTIQVRADLPLPVVRPQVSVSDVLLIYQSG